MEWSTSWCAGRRVAIRSTWKAAAPSPARRRLDSGWWISRKPERRLGITPVRQSIVFRFYRTVVLGLRSSRLDEGVWQKAQAAGLEQGAAPAGRVLSTLRSGGHGIPPLGTTTQRLGTPCPASDARVVWRRARRPTNAAAKRREASALRDWARDASSGVLRVPRHGTRQGAAIRTCGSRRFAPSAFLHGNGGGRAI